MYLSPVLTSIPQHIQPFWKRFLRSRLGPENSSDLFFETFRIGTTPRDADKGARLILDGDKTATSSLLWEYESSGSPLPAAGALSVVEDGEGQPVCVVQTTRVEVLPFGEIDAGFARAYGETDGTLEGWYEVFGKYYSDACESMGRELNDETPLLCEYFEVIFPDVSAESR